MLCAHVCDYTVCVCVCVGGYWRVYVEDVSWALMRTPAARVSSILMCLRQAFCFQGCFRLGFLNIFERYHEFLQILDILKVYFFLYPTNCFRADYICKMH